MAKIEQILELERIEENIFRGIATETLLPRTFGGQVAGQSLVSAVRTVVPEYHVHSLHGYFIRPGNPTKGIVYQVERMRDGRSFCTRRVTAVQDGHAIFTMSASFHVGDHGIEHQDSMPTVPAPEELPDAKDTLVETDADYAWAHREWSDWDLRFVPRDRMAPAPGRAARQQVWFRSRDALPDDGVFHVCTLAYMSDMTLLGSASVAHPEEKTQGASLDHAMWFLRPFRADDWLLYDQTSPSAGFGRALTQGRIFDRHGNMVAAVVQEGMARYLREP
ncbi:MAG: acyl-CoA thioesterase II [Rhodococcus sp.]|uniref:acyl-CoA thioesterase n=1 Tax=Rhodococcus TaxID=1827 RepID=UPI0016BC4D2D|nr:MULTISPECIES: acyl-CoA thioesterase II [Rhodococcus]NLV79242.1 acyl-CoA thioesterase II [Rhodococcus sp. (in: high G+C Gram-positive bacteria)]